MCALVDNVKSERRIYESVRRIYDIQSSSEDSLDHRKRRRSLIKNSRAATRTASLFIDRLKSEFQRGDDFVPRFRSHRNWCPSKFPSKYFSEREDRERAAAATVSLGKSVSKNFARGTPKIYAIGLCESRVKEKIDDDDNDDNDEQDGVMHVGDTIEYLKRCSLLTPRTTESDVPDDPPREEDSKKGIFALPSLPTLSIPLLPSLPIPTDCVTKNKNTVSRSRKSSRKNRVASCDRSESAEKEVRVRARAATLPRTKSSEKDRRSREISKKRIYSSEFDSKLRRNGTRDDFVCYSISRRSFVEKSCESESVARRSRERSMSNERSIRWRNQFLSNEVTPKDRIEHEEIMVNIVNCKTSQEFLRDGSPDQLVEDLFLENISIGSSTSKSKEFFSPIETTRQMEAVTRVTYDENEILEDIKRRIDADFERSSLKFEEDFDDFCLSHDSQFFDKSFSMDSESFLDLDDDLLAGIEQSKSMPMLTSTTTNRRTSKSMTLMSSTLIEDDFYDPKSPRATLSRETFKDCRTNIDVNDTKYPSCTDLSSVNSINYPSIFDSPLTYLESTIVSLEKNDATGSMLEHRNNFDVNNILSGSFSISDVSMNKEYESASSKNEMSCLDFSRETEEVALASSKLECETARESSDYDRSRTNLARSAFLQGSSLKQRKSSKHLVESIDSGVMTDYSRNDLRAGGSIAERNNRTNACYVYENQWNANLRENLPTFDFDSDSSYSDESLDRRVDRAVKKCTEDLIVLERRFKVKLRRMDNETDESRNDPPTFYDWSSADERLGNISTPSLVSLTDSDAS